MARHEINIALKADGSKAVGEFGKVGKASTDLIVNIKKIGNIFGELGGHVGGFIQNFLKGGVWGIAQSVVAMAVSAITKWRDSAKEAAEKASEAMKKSADEIKATLDSINKDFSSGVSAVDKYTSRLEKQIETTKRLALAEKELEKQRALASGDKEGAIKADEAMAVISAKSAEEMEAARVKSYERRRALAVDAERKANKELDKATAEVDKINAKRQAMIGDPGRRGDRSVQINKFDESSAWGRANMRAVAWFGMPELEQNRDPQFMAKVRDFRDRAFREERKKLFKSDEWKKSGEDLAAASETSNKASKTLFDLRQALANIDAEEKRRLDENAAKKKESEAKAIADTSAAERKAAEDAAKERDRLDRELHQRRMADLRAELEARKAAQSREGATAAAASAEFERAFAMWRDPSRAAAEIGEEKSREADLERLHRDARRYGGKWRIDELAGMYSRGDSEGARAALASWRKSGSFTPEVEAMVRASAAEKTRTTAEDELRKIEGNTRDLSRKLDELMRMKG